MPPPILLSLRGSRPAGAQAIQPFDLLEVGSGLSDWIATADCARLAMTKGMRFVALLGLAAATALSADTPPGTPFAARSAPAGATLFTVLPGEQTGLTAVNRYDDPAMWAARYREFSLGAIGIFGEIFLGLGFWLTVARGAVVLDADTLDDVHATDEDPALAGEGLADALNVGAF